MRRNIRLNIFISIIFVCFIISLFLINILSKKVIPIFMNYAVSKIKENSIKIINDVVKEEMLNISIDDLIYITKNNNNDIQMIDYNTRKVNTILNSTTTNVLNKLNDLKISDLETLEYKNGFIEEVPIGVIFDNVFFSNMGPKIPVKLTLAKDVYSNILTSIKEYGINNALLTISINISVNEKVIVPFITKDVSISLDIPISVKLIQGNIPIYYGEVIEKKSNLLVQ